MTTLDRPPEDAVRTLARGSFAVFAVRMSALGLRFLLSLALVKAIGSAGYGAFSYALNGLAIALVPATLGLDQLVSRYLPLYRANEQWSLARGLLRWVQQRGLAASLAVAAVGASIALIMPSPAGSDRATTTLVLLAVPLVVACQLRQAVMRGLDAAGAAQIPENIIYPVVLGLSVWGAYLWRPELGTSAVAAILNVVAWSVTLLVGAALLRPRVAATLSAVASEARDAKAWAGPLLALTLSAGAYQLFSRSDALILGWFATKSEVGVYAVSWRAAELMAFVYEATLLAGTPVFSRIYATGDMDALQSFTRVVTRSILWFSIPAVPLFYWGAPWFLSLYGPEFAAGVPVLRIMVFAYFVSNLSGFVLQMLYVTGGQVAAAITVGSAAALNIILSLLLVPRLGSTGAALSAGISVVMMKATLVVILYRRIGIVSLPFSLGLRRPAGNRAP